MVTLRPPITLLRPLRAARPRAAADSWLSLLHLGLVLLFETKTRNKVGLFIGVVSPTVGEPHPEAQG